MDSTDTETMLKLCPACGQLFVASFELCQTDNCKLKSITDEELVGTVFDNTYRILSLIGKGGMSIVYKAMHKDLGVEVALKMLKLALLEEESVKARFIREAEVLQTLNHPNIVSIKEFKITTTGQPYLVMDYLPGQTLASYLQDYKSVPAAHACELFRQICSALEHAHKHGVVHRDLKPGNIILLTEDDKTRAMIVDFGIAKFLPSLNQVDQKLTKTGHAFGTPIYMSPEQWRGESVEERSDIYSLGCIMCEVLCGKVPYDLDSLAMIIYNNEDPSSFSLRERNPSLQISEELEQIVLKCISFEKASRFRSVSELSAALSSCPENRSQDANSESNSGTARLAESKTKRKTRELNKTLLAAGGVATIFLLLLFVGAQLIAQGRSGKADVLPTKLAISYLSVSAGSKQEEQIALRNHLAELYMSQKDYRQSAIAYDEVLRLLESSSSKENEASIAYACLNYSHCLANLPAGQKQSKDMATRALRLFKDLASDSFKNRDFPNAIKYSEQILVLTTDLKSSNLEQASAMSRLADYQQHLALTDSSQRNLLFEAEKNHEKSIRLLNKTPDSGIAGKLHDKMQLCLVYLEQNRYQNAKRSSEAALDEAMLVYKDNDPQLQALANYVETVANHLFNDRKYDQAEYLFQRVLHVRENGQEKDSRAAGCAAFYIGNCELFRKRFDKGESFLKRALAIYKKHDGSDSYPTALVYLSLAQAQVQLRELDEARKSLGICIPAFRKITTENTHLQMALKLYADVLYRLGAKDESHLAVKELQVLQAQTEQYKSSSHSSAE